MALAALLPVREHWRLWPLVRSARCAWTSRPTAPSIGGPTVVGCFDPDGLATFISGRNLEALPVRLAAHPIWVTFNGTCFDLPVLRRAFPELPAPALHLDLRGVTRRMGLGGGLKAIEDRLGIARPLHLRGTGGREAVALWRAYRGSGALEPLRALVEYIEESRDAGPSLEQMAAVARLSPYHFARQFNRASGLPPHQYVLGASCSSP